MLGKIIMLKLPFNTSKCTKKCCQKMNLIGVLLAVETIEVWSCNKNATFLCYCLVLMSNIIQPDYGKTKKIIIWFLGNGRKYNFFKNDITTMWWGQGSSLR